MEISTQGSIARRHDLDALRAIAMLLGIVLHAALAFYMPMWPIKDSQQEQWYSLIFEYLHGFRMPLFFVLSGFFTAMLWRKRGLASLLWHRFRRIFLPLVVSMFTFLPLMYLSVFVGMYLAGDINFGQNQENTQSNTSSIDLWASIERGDIESIQTYADEGNSLDIMHPEFRVFPLQYAVFHHKPDVMQALIDHGADINQKRDDDGSTVLHTSAFLGYHDCVDVLLKNNADHTLYNHYYQTPTESLHVDWATTQFVLNMLQIDLTKEQLMDGRAKSAAVFQKYGIEAGSEQIQDSNIMGLLQAFPFFNYLWFLWFLCILIAGFSLYAFFAKLFRWNGPALFLTASPIAYLWLIPLTLIPQFQMFEPTFGPDTSLGLIPYSHVLFYYAIFFFFGALYYDSPDDDQKLGRGYWITLPFATFILFPIGILFAHHFESIQSYVDPSLQEPVSNIIQVSFTWLMTFGLMGLFSRFFNKERYWMRYISDSSYWLYLLHMPVMFIVQGWIQDWQLPAIVKFIFVIVVVTGFCLLTYQFMVRYTFIGTFLNGKRTRPVKSVEESTVPN